MILSRFSDPCGHRDTDSVTSAFVLVWDPIWKLRWRNVIGLADRPLTIDLGGVLSA